MAIITQYAKGNSKAEALLIANNVVEFNDLTQEAVDTIVNLLASSITLTGLPIAPEGIGLVFGYNGAFNNPGSVFYYNTVDFSSSNSGRLLTYKHDATSAVNISGSISSTYQVTDKLELGPLIPTPSSSQTGLILVSSSGTQGAFELQSIRDILRVALPPKGIGQFINLEDLNDVTINTPTNGDVLIYSEPFTKWYNEKQFNIADKLVRLDTNGKIPASLLPGLTTDVTVYFGDTSTPIVNNGDFLVNTITQTSYISQKQFGAPGNWVELLAASPVISINNMSGNVNLKLGDLADVETNSFSTTNKQFIVGPYNITKPGLYIGQGWKQDTVILNNLANVSISSSVANGDILIKDSVNWVSRKLVLNDLSNVTVSSILVAGQVLKYNGFNWTNTLLTLNDLSGISIGSATEGDVLIYKSSKWTNTPFTVNNISNVLAPTTVNYGDTLKYNGSNWTIGSYTLDNLSDVTITTPVVKEVLRYDGFSWKNSRLSLTDLNNITLNSLSVNDALIWDGSNWINRSITESVASSISKLRECADVRLVSPIQTNQILSYNVSGKWENTNLSLFTSWADCSITSAVDGQIIIYRGSKWINDYAKLNDLQGVSISPSVTAGQVLYYDSTKWINRKVSFNELYDVSVSSVLNNQVISWNGNKWTNTFVNANMFDTISAVNRQVLSYMDGWQFKFLDLEDLQLPLAPALASIPQGASFVYNAGQNRWEINTVTSSDIDGLNIIKPGYNGQVIKCVVAGSKPVFQNDFLRLSELQDVRITNSISTYNGKFLQVNKLNDGSYAWTPSTNFNLKDNQILIGNNTDKLNKYNSEIFIGHDSGPAIDYDVVTSNDIIIGNNSGKNPILTNGKSNSKDNIIIGNNSSPLHSSETKGYDSNNVIIGNRIISEVRGKLKNSVIIGAGALGNSISPENIINSIIIGYNSTAIDNNIEYELRVHNGNSHIPLLHGSFKEPHRWLTVNGRLQVNTVNNAGASSPVVALSSRGIEFYDDTGVKTPVIELATTDKFTKKLKIKINGNYYYLRLSPA